MRRIALVERGRPALVPAAETDGLLLGEALRELSLRGIVESSPVPGFGHLITPRNFVGELRLPFITIEVSPKIDGFVAAAEKLALTGVERTAQELQYELGEGKTSDPYLALVWALHNLIAEDGLPWSYKRTERVGAPRGRLDAQATIRRFAARGVFHQVVSQRSERREDHEFISVMWAALRIAALERGSTVIPSSLASVFLALPPDPQCDRSRALMLGRQLDKAYRSTPAVAHCVGIALSVLANEERRRIEAFPVECGYARFRNLEDLWERAVTSIFARLAPTFGAASAVAHAYRGSGLHLFDSSGPELDPDVVLGGGPKPIVVDAKYKFAISPAPADLYQLVAYLRRTGGAVGILAFPTEAETRAELVGMSADDEFIVLAVWINPGQLANDGLNPTSGSLLGLAENFEKLRRHGLG
jgi:hypothetical protein